MSAKENRLALAAIKSKLETAAKPPAETPILPWIFAHRLGDWKPHESVATAGARGLGFEGPRGAWAMQMEMSHEPEKFAKRYANTFGRLMDEAGVDFDTVTAADIEAIIEKWTAELPAGMPRPS